jgi:hypothetical protein
MTMRELWWLAEARWDHTATLARLLAEPYRDPESHPVPYVDAEFNPLAKKPKPQKPANWIPYNEDLLEQIATGKFY